jgi:hypothetical protein
MAIVVLVLWLFTAGAGFYLLVTSNLGRARPAESAISGDQPGLEAQTPSAASVSPASRATTAAQASSVTTATPSAQTTGAHPVPGAPADGASRREMRRASRDRFVTPSLAAARKAPIVPDLRSVAEFAHPACAITGLGFWLGFTLVHYRVLGWIAFGLIVLTACIGLAWFTANTRAARRRGDAGPAPSFTGRLILLHGGAAAVTLTLAALTALVTRG